MSRKLIDKARRRLEAETGCTSNPWGGRLSVALVYPNSYSNAMSNLGFLSVYSLINGREDALCERFFLPDPDDLVEHRKTGYPLFSLESGRRLGDFDVVAFSVPFENDYTNLPAIFELGGIPLRASDRGDSYPLVICGGVCAFLNPEPMASIMDLFVVGEGEAILPALLDAIGASASNGAARPDLLRALSALPGIYAPALYRPEYDEEGRVLRYHPEEGAPPKVARQYVEDLDSCESRSFIQTEETAFSDMALTEISRGCSRGCRFCAAGYLYLPPRERSLEALVGQVAEGLCSRSKVGLVSAAVSDYSRIDELEKEILQRGGQVSVASLRIDSLSASEVAALQASGHRTVALAPEAGSQRMRDLINKGIDADQILGAVRLLANGGIPNLKLYFLIGLPGERLDDIEEMLELVEEIRLLWREEGQKRGRLGNITLSVNPFVPKPFTPFQWAAMASEKELNARIKVIRSRVGRMANTAVNFESVRGAVIQAFLSRGDRRIMEVIQALAEGKNLKAACRGARLDPAFYLTREREADEVFPWEILESGVARDYLWKEYRRGIEGKLTPRCSPGCTRCGVCG